MGRAVGALIAVSGDGAAGAGDDECAPEHDIAGGAHLVQRLERCRQSGTAAELRQLHRIGDQIGHALDGGAAEPGNHEDTLARRPRHGGDVAIVDAGLLVARAAGFHRIMLARGPIDQLICHETHGESRRLRNRQGENAQRRERPDIDDVTALQRGRLEPRRGHQARAHASVAEQRR